MSSCNHHLRLINTIKAKATELQKEKKLFQTMEGAGHDIRTGCNFLCKFMPDYCPSKDIKPPEISMNNKECIETFLSVNKGEETFLNVIFNNKGEIKVLKKILKKLLKSNGEKWTKSWSGLEDKTKIDIAAICKSEANQEAWRNLQIAFDRNFNELKFRISGIQYDLSRCIAALQVEGEDMQTKNSKDVKHHISSDILFVCDEQSMPTSYDNTGSPQDRSRQDRNANCESEKKGIAQDSPKGVVDMPKVAALQLSSHLPGHDCMSPNDTVFSPRKDQTFSVTPPVIERKEMREEQTFTVPSKPNPVSCQRKIMSPTTKRKKISVPKGSELSERKNISVPRGSRLIERKKISAPRGSGLRDFSVTPPVIERKEMREEQTFTVPSKPNPVSCQRKIMSPTTKRKKISVPKGSELSERKNISVPRGSRLIERKKISAPRGSGLRDFSISVPRGAGLSNILNAHKRKNSCPIPCESSCPVEKKRRVARNRSFADLIAHDYSAQLERSLVKLQNGGNEGPHAKTGRGQILNKIESAKGLWSIEAIGSSNQQGIQHENDLVRNMISSVETGLIEIR